MKTIAIIPVRGGSKSIPLKNIKLLNNRPLVYWTIDAAVQCNYIDEVYVMTDSEKIKEVVEEYDKSTLNKLKIIERSAETATDTASTESVMKEFVSKVTSEKLVLLQATSPLTTSEHLDAAFLKMDTDKLDSILSVVRQKRFIWKEDNKNVEPVNYNPAFRPRRQDFNGFLVENGAFYITKTDLFKETGVRISGEIGVFEMPEETYFEIDEPSDWLIVESIMKKRKSANTQIKLFATDCDGVLTDGGMYYSNKGEVVKKFNTKDGMGFELLRKKGIYTAILTGENSETVLQRSKKIKTDDLYLGCKDKVSAMEELMKKYKLQWHEIAYIGDDINDKELLQKVGMSFSVNDGMQEIKQVVDFVTTRSGGQGAVREAIEYMLMKNDLKG